MMGFALVREDWWDQWDAGDIWDPSVTRMYPPLVP